MTLDFFCDQCDHHVQLNVLCNDDYRIEAWCCTAHVKPVRMTTTDPHSR